jgi:hypothetical protein
MNNELFIIGLIVGLAIFALIVSCLLLPNLSPRISNEFIYYERIGALDSFEQDGVVVNPRAMTPEQFQSYATAYKVTDKNGIT